MATDLALRITKVSARLGGRRVLNEVDLQVRAGEVVALFGHNGAGKSTLLRCIMGLLPFESGAVQLGFATWKPDPRALAQLGLRYLPQNEKLFSDLTVVDNLRIFSEAAQVPQHDFRRHYDTLAAQFPVLRDARSIRAGRLSGGEGQQVALARTLLGQPRLVLMDEPSLGLASSPREQTFRAIRDVATRDGAAVLLAEHRVRDALEIANRAYVMRQGTIVVAAEAQELLEKPDYLRAAVI